jgi:hypothetical protein
LKLEEADWSFVILTLELAPLVGDPPRIWADGFIRSSQRKMKFPRFRPTSMSLSWMFLWTLIATSNTERVLLLSVKTWICQTISSNTHKSIYDHVFFDKQRGKKGKGKDQTIMTPQRFSSHRKQNKTMFNDEDQCALYLQKQVLLADLMWKLQITGYKILFNLLSDWFHYLCIAVKLLITSWPQWIQPFPTLL